MIILTKKVDESSGYYRLYGPIWTGGYKFIHNGKEYGDRDFYKDEPDPETITKRAKHALKRLLEFEQKYGDKPRVKPIHRRNQPSHLRSSVPGQKQEILERTGLQVLVQFNPGGQGDGPDGGAADQRQVNQGAGVPGGVL